MTQTSSGPTVYLHIGTPKSGTTYLQSRFSENHELSREQGLLWPGPKWGTQVEAVRDLRTLRPGKPLSPKGPWMRLAETAQSWTGPKVLISMEWLSGCTPEVAAFAVASLKPVRVEVICTARDLLRCFAAQWQEMTKNCHPWSWSQFVTEMLEDTSGPARQRFWNQQDVPGILHKWAEVVPWDRIHLVTVPSQGADPDLLWRRFCSVLGVDGTSYSQPPRDNESLGVVSASLMHRVNLAAIARDVTHDEYQRVFHLRLADEVLAPRRDDEQPIAVSPEVDSWIRARADRLVEDLRSLDVDLVGDLADLLPGKALAGREPDDVTDTELLDTCVDALVSLSMSQHEVVRRLRSQQQDLKRQIARLGGTSEA